MKIRVTGTKKECQMASDYYNSLRGKETVKYICVSDFYPTRGSDELYRVYIEIEYFETVEPTENTLKQIQGD